MGPPVADSGARQTSEFHHFLLAASGLDKFFCIHLKQFNDMHIISQQIRSEFNRQKMLPFALEKNMNEPMALADRIRTVILEMDGENYGKQARLAEIAKCGRPVVNHWLSGQQGKINAKHALKISDALGYEVKWLMEGKGPKKKGERSPDMDESGETLFMLHVSQKEMDLVMAYRNADPMDRILIEHVTAKVTRTKNN